MDGIHSTLKVTKIEHKLKNILIIMQGGDDNLDAINEAIVVAKSVTDRPSIIKIKTTIGFGSKNQGNSLECVYLWLILKDLKKYTERL